MKDTLIFLDNLLNVNDSVIIACSGGPDSMCLLNVIKSYKEKYNLNIICAHVNHGLRIESEEEKVFVKKYCESNDIIFEYLKIEKYTNNKFSEEEARRKRYAFFDNLAKKYNAKYLMTAHHGYDLIETILMRITRGSNLKGYAGIPIISKNERYSIVRPLLNLTKEDILKYLECEEIEYVLDKTNQDEKYTRNRFRKHMLPILKNEDEQVHLKFLKYSKELEMAKKYIDKVIESKIKNIYVENYIVINKLLEEDEYLQEKIIEYVIEDIQKKEIFNINDNQFNNIIKLINNDKNKIINLADGFIARKSYNKLYIEKNSNVDKYEYILKNNLNILNKYNFEFIKDSKEKNNFIIRLNSEEITLPLIVRPKKDGDKIKVKNMIGTKKVKDIFINSKIDVKIREEYPIIIDSKNNIIWIPGIKKSIFDKEINEKYDIILKYTEENNEQSK